MPVTAISGLAATMIIWIIILITQPYSRGVGVAWMAAGFIIYYFYRRRQHMPLTHTDGEQEELIFRSPEK